MTGHGDIPLAVETMKLGAVDFMEKPLSHRDLLDRVTHAHGLIQLNSEEADLRREARQRIDALTERELAVLRALIAGLSSKDIAHRFGRSVRTVESQRASMMARLKVKSLGAAFSLAMAAGVEPLT
jgi:two-component system response regulator FixJ